MNLAKLFETQKVLRDRIGYNEPDRFNKLVLALLVELGELANEWRGFKFWSKDQKPRVSKSRAPYMDLNDADFYNPLLEEYVDGLHFVLELGIEIGYAVMKYDKYFVFVRKIELQFTNIMQSALHVQHQWIHKGSRTSINKEYEDLVYLYIGLGEMLGFIWEQIESTYFQKNAVNHARQDSGY